MQMIHCYNLCHLFTGSGTFHFLHQFLCSVSTSLFFSPASLLRLHHLSASRFKTGVRDRAFFESNPESHFAFVRRFLTGAQQARETTASCRMQANIVLCFTVVSAGVPLGYHEITYWDNFCSFTETKESLWTSFIPQFHV